MIDLLMDIPHNRQRYETCGDWELYDYMRIISVSQLKDPRFMELLKVHELIEAILCQHRGIRQSVVDSFDVAYETNRPVGDLTEPGNDPKAPYHREHTFATFVEKLLANELGVDWQEYENAINALE